MKRFAKVVIWMVLGVVVSWASLAAWPETEAVTVEYSRITMGGSSSGSERYEVSDSLTQYTTATAQSSSRYSVVSLKAVLQETSDVTNWKDYN